MSLLSFETFSTNAQVANFIGSIERRPLPSQVTVECSTDLQYLSQYYFIRQYVYQNDLKVPNFPTGEDSVDQRSHIIIARIGHFCIGGLRLTISTKASPEKLTMERGDFNLCSFIPELIGTNYCDIGRVAILPQYREYAPLPEMLRLAAEIAKSYECQFLFGASPPSLARLFQKIFRQLGYRYATRSDIEPPVGKENQHLQLIFQTVYLED